jgi:hypothetical protein
MWAPMMGVREQLRLHVVLFASIIIVIIFSSSATGALLFPVANALTVSENIQFASNNATSTELQEPLGPSQEAIANHLDMARQALRSGNLTMAIQELIFAVELQSGILSDIGIAENETQSRMELQTAPFPPNT